MPPRLVDLYQPGDAVEIFLSDADCEQWRAGQVRGAQHPGIWVQTDDGRLWFVTNGRRIRAKTHEEGVS
ncbi:MAG: hypothetical protein MUC51_08575 [Anaerolineae bacterium]|jgi:hypothetical protein|nr:hypothetical protein [Anaerolineae bacterium]